MLSTLSVKAKVLATLSLVFVALMAGTITYTFVSERRLVHDVVLQKAYDTAYAYFDGVNTMMLTGTTAQRETLRGKLLSNPDVLEVHLLRADAVSAVFGPGLPHEQPADDLDRDALQGVPGELHGERDGARTVTIVKPVQASKDYRGTNCLTCHAVPEDTVLGAVRVTYSLRSVDQRIHANLLTSAAINAAFFGLGIAVLAWLLRRQVFLRLGRMRDTMRRVERESNLALRIPTGANDEIGQVGGALNAMLERFDTSLHQVADTTRQLSEAAERIAGVAEQTARGAADQQARTGSMATAINQMEATAQEVRRNAVSTAEASHGADAAARDGTRLTANAIQGIRQLVEELCRAEDVIGRLDGRSRNVGSVLDVIKGIAEQTNLLALNAAIEAARAGEKGRGFAVVADEVRTLATRSHASTQEIEHIIAQLQQEAGEAVNAMSGARQSAEQRSAQIASAAQSLEQIAAQVANISALNTQMARAAEEQGTVTEEAGRNVLGISQIADHTAREAEQTAAISDELVNLAHRLDQMVKNFRR